MLHLKASQKTALDHTLRRKKLLALRAATTEELRAYYSPPMLETSTMNNESSRFQSIICYI
jgi:hypothetical protein